MCFYTTYLFSVCGHIGVSDSPTKHIPPCTHATTRGKKTNRKGAGIASQNSGSSTLPNSPDTPQGRLSCNSFTNPFPSPQEFEVVKQIHDSIPASPVTPTDTAHHKEVQEEGKTDVLDSYTGGSKRPQSLTVTAVGARTVTPTDCQIVTRHPLQTYVLPLLCHTCSRQREHNLARFEAQTIKESVYREKWDYRKVAMGGIVDPERKKIARRSAGKGKLIPLICVEETKIRKEQGVPMDVKQGHSRDIIEQLSQEGVLEEPITPTLTELVNIVESTATEATETARRESQLKVEPAQPTVSATSQSSGWSWFRRNQSAEPTRPNNHSVREAQSVTAAARSEAVDTVSSTTHHNSLPVLLSPRSTAAGIDWSAMQERWRGINSNVSRDVFGRNAQGMNRIMGWDGGGAIRPESTPGTLDSATQ